MMTSNQKEEINKLTIFTFLKYFISDYFPQFTVSFNAKQIYIRGTLSDVDWRSRYEFLICASLTSAPSTYLLQPEIKPSIRIHM